MAAQTPILPLAEAAVRSLELRGGGRVVEQLPAQPGDGPCREGTAARLVIRGAMSDVEVGVDGRQRKALQVFPVLLGVGMRDIALAADEVGQGRVQLAEDVACQTEARVVLVAFRKDTAVEHDGRADAWIRRDLER